MATLTLKKPRKVANPSIVIAGNPLPDFIGQYAVMRQSNNTKSMRFTCIHATQDSATREAMRLKAEQPHNRFLVMQVVSCVEG